MNTADLLLSAWDWEPSVVIGCIALAGTYLVASRKPSLQTGVFLAGTLVLLLDLVSPIDTLGDHYLFSAHVLQHFLLALIIPPLWILGTPASLAERALRVPWVRRAERLLSRPFVAWSIGVGAMLGWHIPALFNAALSSDALHIAQHLSFLISGAIFWWPIFGPLTARRLTALPAVSYLFSACVACSLLGAVLTFTPPGAYPAYLHPDDPLGALSLIRGAWGLDPKTDQQLGGMLMWVPGCLVYLTAILASVRRWYTVPEPV